MYIGKFLASMGWVNGWNCLATILPAVIFSTLWTDFFLGVAVYAGGHLPPEINRPIARQNQVRWRKLQDLRDSFLGIMNVLNGKIVRLLSFISPKKYQDADEGRSIFRVFYPLWCWIHVLPFFCWSKLNIYAWAVDFWKAVDHSNFFHMANTATVINFFLSFIVVGLSIYFHRQDRGHGVLGTLDVLLRPFRERRDCEYMSLDFLGGERVKGDERHDVEGPHIRLSTVSSTWVCIFTISSMRTVSNICVSVHVPSRV